ncbi:serine/threonine-protein kinase STY46-like isoform X2 [Tripterygium wilfordii]|uniref:serine/threonine-protein kinase STY46-like isoform X2 n=1 Tax=Tripterygium wilfordii TaxID=458696 RepID=UPI0018F7F051|nr:serine/threonine-protein kinase STY46-like isoform X2 [Tripterygium wilfordii]
MDLTEGVGESSSPPRGFGSFSNYDVRNDVYNRLTEIGTGETVSNPEFRELLDAHFNRLPASYGLDVNMDRVEDVLLHQKLLSKAQDPEERPVYHIRFLENLCNRADGDYDGQFSSTMSIPQPPSDEDNESVMLLHKRQDVSSVPIHEVIFSTVDKPKLLSQLSALLSDIGLNIREAHVFSTTDGYSLDVFVVDGWPTEDTDDLYKAMEKAVARHEGSWSGSSHGRCAANKGSAGQAKIGDWEIDRRLLKIEERIAFGSCGDLYRGNYLGQDVAVKVLRSERLNAAVEEEFTQEVAILREVHHRNVVRFIGACTKFPHLCIVTEYMPGGSLYDYLHKNHNVLKLSQLLKFGIDVCKGMNYLHQNNIIHRDLKTANLLMDTHNVVKVADFGVARFQNQEGVMTAETGTYRWMAPEVINHQPYDQKADVFSFAIVLWELVTAKIPYDNMTPLQAALGVRQGLRPDLPENTHPKLLELMQRCWEAVPNNRPSFSEITAELETLLPEVEETIVAVNGS